MQNKIIGFRLIKQYPGCPQILNSNGQFETRKAIYCHGIWVWTDCGLSATTEKLLEWSEFWQPIYRGQDVVDIHKIDGYTSMWPMEDKVYFVAKAACEALLDLMADDIEMGRLDAKAILEYKKRII